MTRDASLDEFLGGDDEDAEPGDDDNGPGDGAAGDDAANDDGSAASEAPDADTAAEAADADAATDADAPDGAEPAVDAENGAPLDPDAVAPAASTYAWTPNGATCAACGATVERRWRDESGLVCADCKEW